MEALNFWLLKVLPENLAQLADVTEVAPVGMTLPEWKSKLLEMARLFREADTDTCERYAEQLKKDVLTEQERYEIEDYCDRCKTEAFSELSYYFWYLNV